MSPGRDAHIYQGIPLRVQYEVEIQTALVNLRTAKIQLQQLLNDRTPVEQFDVTGPFDFADSLRPLEEFRQIALDARPDLRAALEAVQQAQTNHRLAVANGSADPTFSTWYSYNPAFNNPFGRYTLGASVSVPLRIFDRNQGEKQRTLIDIDRNKELTEAARAQVFSDVDGCSSGPDTGAGAVPARLPNASYVFERFSTYRACLRSPERMSAPFSTRSAKSRVVVAGEAPVIVL